MRQLTKSPAAVWLVSASTLVLTAAAPMPAGRAAAAATTRYAIKDARIVTMAGAPIETGTIVFQNGVIEDVGPSAAVPEDAVVVDGTKLTVYPGFIDLWSTEAVDVPEPTIIEPARGAPPLTPSAAFEEQGRARRTAMLRADVDAARYVRFEGPVMRRLASAGITTVLAVPSAGLLRGRSALINVLAPPDDPQISGLADNRRAQVVVKAPVAQHIGFAGGGRGGYPASLLGTMAFVRQALHDAKWQRDARAFAEKHPERPRPAVDPALDALAPVVDGMMPAAFEADSAMEIARALALAREFSLDPIIVGAREADSVVADLKATRARVIYSIDFPTPPEPGRGGRGGRGVLTPPEPDESIREMRMRQNAPKVPRALESAGVPFAFTTGGMEDLTGFMANAARMVKDGGLSSDALLAALTVNAARLVGVDNRLGTLQKGRIANIVVTEGAWPDEGTRIRHVFIDGVPAEIDPAPAAPARGRSGGER